MDHQEEVEEIEAPPREESNDFRITIPGRGATNFVIVSFVFLIFLKYFNVLFCRVLVLEV